MPTLCTRTHAHTQTQTERVFRVKKTRVAPMGRPKLELLASNDVHICHAI